MVELGMEDNALKVHGKTNSETAEETAFVASPTVAMRIADRRGEDIHTAQVSWANAIKHKQSLFNIYKRGL